MMLVTFHTISAALYLEKLLTARSIGCRIVPVPRSLSSSCGYAAEVAGQTPEALTPLLAEYALEWEAIYCATPDGKYTLLIHAG